MANASTFNEKALMSLAQDALESATFDPTNGILSFPNDIRREIVHLCDLGRIALLAHVRNHMVKAGRIPSDRIVIFADVRLRDQQEVLYPPDYIPRFIERQRAAPVHAHRAAEFRRCRELWATVAAIALVSMAVLALDAWSKRP